MPHNAPTIEVRKLGRDATREMPSAVSSRQKVGHMRTSVLDVLLDEMLDETSGKNTDFPRKFNKQRVLLEKVLGRLERVKGIEPSYSAWKAAALPLSYTRAPRPRVRGRRRSLTRPAASLNCPGLDNPLPVGLPQALPGPRFPRQRFREIRLLTRGQDAPILGAPPTTKGGDPVSQSKRCHLAGIAR
jgi:hypothetical protein